MPSLHHGAIVIGVFLTVTGGSTAFLSSKQTHAFSICCVTMGAFMLVMGFFWAVKGKRNSMRYSSDNALDYSQVLFTPPHGSNVAVSPSVNSHRTVDRESRRGYEEESDYPPMEPTSLSPPPWGPEPPPPYEVAIRTTTSSTHLRRTYSDTFRPTEPLFGCSREISFEV